MLAGRTRTIRASSATLRRADATARAILVAAAAQQWNVDAGTCEARYSVIYGQDGQTAPYGRLAVQAATAPVRSEIALTYAKDFQLIGRPVKRLNTQAETTATATFGIDVKVPGMLVAQIDRAPAMGATV